MWWLVVLVLLFLMWTMKPKKSKKPYSVEIIEEAEAMLKLTKEENKAVNAFQTSKILTPQQKDLANRTAIQTKLHKKVVDAKKAELEAKAIIQQRKDTAVINTSTTKIKKQYEGTKATIFVLILSASVLSFIAIKGLTPPMSMDFWYHLSKYGMGYVWTGVTAVTFIALAIYLIKSLPKAKEKRDELLKENKKLLEKIQFPNTPPKV